jgi:hypothetical protein
MGCKPSLIVPKDLNGSLLKTPGKENNSALNKRLAKIFMYKAGFKVYTVRVYTEVQNAPGIS